MIPHWWFPLYLNLWIKCAIRPSFWNVNAADAASSENNSFSFTVNADGSNPLITNVSIEGHPDASIIVVKENSSYVAQLYEGSYEGIDQNNDQGTFNAIVFNGAVYILSKSSVYGSSSYASGLVDGNLVSGASSLGTIFGLKSPFGL